MKKHLTVLVFTALSAIALYAGPGARLANAAPGDIYNLGTLGGISSFGYGINDAGQVAGYSYLASDRVTRAFRYDGTPGSGGAMHDLGTLGGTNSLGFAINAAGQVAGGTSTTGDAAFPAFRYDGTPGSGGAMADLGTLGGRASGGFAINDAGQVAGFSQISNDNTVSHAFRYTGSPGSGGAMADLGTLGGTDSVGNAINNAGQVAGRSHTTGNAAEHAFRYTGSPGSGGAMADLGTLGGTNSTATAINDAGQVAGQAQMTGDTVSHAFRYTGTPGLGGAMVDLGTLGRTSVAYDINDAGFVVGSARPAGASDGTRATLWQIDAANTAVDLDAWLDATDPTLGAYWMLTQAHGINNNGLITGQGTYDDGPGGLRDGLNIAFILDASSLVVPEPASLALLAFGLPLIVWRNLRRSRT